MRRVLVFGGVAALLVAAVACAGSDEDDDVVAPVDEGGSPTPEGGATRDAAIASDAAPDARGNVCSSDGWCETTLPNVGLTIKDIWPVEGHAFALAESRSFGIRVLEWSDATSSWSYIDDNGANEQLSDYATKIWAPSADEVYFAAAPGTIYHGVRPVAPATAWTWTHEELPAGHPSFGGATRDLVLGVWGVGGEVFAWRTNTIARRSRGDGGAPRWEVEYTVDDSETPNDTVHFIGAAGVRADDVVFYGYRLGARGTCDLAVRRSSEGYRRIADAVAPASFGQVCAARDGMALLPGYASGELSSQIETVDGSRFFILRPPLEILQLDLTGESLVAERRSIPAIGHGSRWGTMWLESEERQWLAGGGNLGAVLRAENIDDADGGTYRYSSTVLNGAPLSKRPLRIRGGSTSNLWAVGLDYALHKTTP